MNNNKVLLLVGGEICHNYFVNAIRKSFSYGVDVVVCHSGKTDFEYYYKIYGIGEMTTEERNRIIDFIFRRNSAFARNEDYESLVRPEGAILTRNATEFNQAVDILMAENDYGSVFSYGVPIIRNARILDPDYPAFNFHLGLSRHYRGGDCNIFALAEGAADKVGLTCHKLSEAVDEGAVLLEVCYPPSLALGSLDDVHHWLLIQATESVCRWLQDGLPPAFPVPKGRLVLNRQLTARHVLAAEDHLARIRNSQDMGTMR